MSGMHAHHVEVPVCSQPRVVMTDADALHDAHVGQRQVKVVHGVALKVVLAAAQAGHRRHRFLAIAAGR